MAARAHGSPRSAGYIMMSPEKQERAAERLAKHVDAARLMERDLGALQVKYKNMEEAYMHTRIERDDTRHEACSSCREITLHAKKSPLTCRDVEGWEPCVRSSSLATGHIFAGRSAVNGAASHTTAATPGQRHHH
jgi:hypothetical protein